LSQPPAERVTLATIAQAAGVTVPTVSRVVNGDERVAAATRARIERLLTEFEYQPRNSRRSPSADTLHVIYPRLDTSWQLEHIRGMEPVTREAGVGLVVSALNHGTEGRLNLLKVPVVTLDPSVQAAAKLPTIGAANWLGARLATKHLIALGHRRIAVITGSKGGLLCSRARLDGYRAALEEAGIAEDPTLVEHGEFEYRSGVAAARQLITRVDPPTAIFAFSDHLALGVYEAARASGLSIPDQLSVVGFDDLPAARWASPPLTTVRQPLEEMGGLAARMILNLVRRKPLESPRMELSTRLVERASTAPPSRSPRR
jgi:LacI family transcriptional regulator